VPPDPIVLTAQLRAVALSEHLELGPYTLAVRELPPSRCRFAADTRAST
jgi:hypothetical protein